MKIINAALVLQFKNKEWKMFNILVILRNYKKREMRSRLLFYGIYFPSEISESIFSKAIE